MRKYIITSSRATPGLESFVVPLANEVIYIWRGKDWTTVSNTIVIPPEALKQIVTSLSSQFGMCNIFCSLLIYSKNTIIVTAIISGVGLITATVKILCMQSLQHLALVKVAESFQKEDILTGQHIPTNYRNEILSCMGQLHHTVEIFPFK